MPGSQFREVHTVATDSQAQEVLLTRDGPVVTLTFNRPEARNALTWNMYERLYQACEEVDADDSVRVLVLRGAGGKAFVAGTDISQFKSFKTAEDGIQYERDGERRTGRLERVGKPVIAQIEGFAVGGGFAIAAVGAVMTRLLVSVRSAAEAEAALRGGADVIDVKEPGRGPLGRADDAVIADVVRLVAGRRPVSAALGELCRDPSSVPRGSRR